MQQKFVVARPRVPCTFFQQLHHIVLDSDLGTRRLNPFLRVRLIDINTVALAAMQSLNTTEPFTHHSPDLMWVHTKIERGQAYLPTFTYFESILFFYFNIYHINLNEIKIISPPANERH